MAEQFGEKSQEATPHRRQKAREDGQVAKSQDLSSATLLIGSLLVMMYLGGSIAQFLATLAQRQLGGPAWLVADCQFAASQWHAIVWELGKVLLPLFGAMFLLAVVINVAQVGFLFLPKKLAFDLKRLNPLKGLKRIFSLSGLIRLLLGMFKVAVVAGVAAWALWGKQEEILGLAAIAPNQVARFIADVTLMTCLKVGVALLILAILDFAYQRWKHEQDLRMTNQEIREEMKQLQGDPQIIARRRAVQRQMVLNRLGGVVPEADVVVTNPTELAVAIRYDPETMIAPIVVAKGAGLVAQRIRRLALEHNIPIVERKPLARALYNDVEVNEAVPHEQYAAVAEILRYVYELTGKTPPSLAA